MSQFNQEPLPNAAYIRHELLFKNKRINSTLNDAYLGLFALSFMTLAYNIAQSGSSSFDGRIAFYFF